MICAQNGTLVVAERRADLPLDSKGLPSLAEASPALAEQWIHPVEKRHQSRTPHNTSAGSGIRVLWRCPKDPIHTWEAKVTDRSRGKGCPHPSHGAGLLADTHPELVSQWIRPVEKRHQSRTPHNTSAGSGIRVLWRCPEDTSHTWEAKITDRSRGKGCAHPSHGAGLLADTHPELVAQWIEPVEERHRHRTPHNTGTHSMFYVRWRCPRNPSHKWTARVTGRSKGRGCPQCQYCRSNPLDATHPELATQWIGPVEDKDKHRTPDNTGAKSAVRVRWRCPDDPIHEWDACVYARARGQGCPHPSHGAGLLAEAHPELSAQWIAPIEDKHKHRTPHDTTSGSEMIVLWRCPKDPTHTWKAQVGARSLGSGCPICSSNGWNRVTLAHFLSTKWEELVTLERETDRRRVFAATPGALATSSRQRSIIEAIIRNELTDKDIAAYIAGTDTVKIQALLANHAPHIYGGKATISPELRARVYARDGHACLACGATTNLSCDHYPLPEIKGGLTEYESLRTLCLPCNCTSRTDALTIEEIRQRRGLSLQT